MAQWPLRDGQGSVVGLRRSVQSGEGGGLDDIRAMTRHGRRAELLIDLTAGDFPT